MSSEGKQAAGATATRASGAPLEEQHTVVEEAVQKPQEQIQEAQPSGRQQDCMSLQFRDKRKRELHEVFPKLLLCVRHLL